MSVLAKMITASNPDSIKNLKNESDKKLANILVQIQDREELEFTRKSELINGQKLQNYQVKEIFEEDSSTFDFGERWESQIEGTKGDNKDTPNFNKKMSNFKKSVGKLSQKVTKKMKSTKLNSREPTVGPPDLPKIITNPPPKDTNTKKNKKKI
jgi:hypothetical protein